MTGRRDISTPSSSRASQLEARIREIEAELDNVHDDMQLLRRVVDKPERSDIYPQYRARVAQAPGASEPSPAIARQEEPAAPADRRPLVAVRRPLSKGRDAAAAIPRTDQTGVPPAAGEQAQPELMTRDPRDHERFASYFHQLDEALALKPRSILEIGVGDRVFGSFFRDYSDIS